MNENVKNETIDVINELAKQCNEIATEKGFHEDYLSILEILGENVEESTVRDFSLMEWFDSTAEQAEIARMHSELSEWTEAIRHNNPPDQHIPTLTSAEVEAADCIIRIFDSCVKRNYNIGKALIEKMEYNKNRPHKHGKNS